MLTMIASIFLMFGLWQAFDPRVIIFFIVGLSLAELFVQLRWRLSLTCPHCGFDPMLYLRKPDAAAEKVKLFYEKRTRDPDFYLSGSPLLKLHQERVGAARLRRKPSKVRTQLSAPKRHGSLLSKRL